MAREARSIRGYIRTLEQSHATGPDVPAWVGWASDYVDRLDPTRTPQGLPEMADKITPDELKPFLPPGVSPYGPQLS